MERVAPAVALAGWAAQAVALVEPVVDRAAREAELALGAAGRVPQGAVSDPDHSAAQTLAARGR